MILWEIDIVFNVFEEFDFVNDVVFDMELVVWEEGLGLGDDEW